MVVGGVTVASAKTWWGQEGTRLTPPTLTVLAPDGTPENVHTGIQYRLTMNPSEIGPESPEHKFPSRPPPHLSLGINYPNP